EYYEICLPHTYILYSFALFFYPLLLLLNLDSHWYNTRTQYLQVRLADGSIHIGKFEFFLEKRTGYVKPAFRLTRQGKEAAEAAAKEAGRRQAVNAIIQEAQRVLTQKIAQNSRITGSREWIALSYTSNIPHLSSIDEDAKETNWIVIFRDGTIYDPYPFNPDQDMRTSFYDRRLASWKFGVFS
ncbi:MAG: hypothetical protein HFF86_11525, partial [Oscillibacter sp.]|nr:hypothetical protein [Oscillibacter sp.]